MRGGLGVRARPASPSLLLAPETAKYQDVALTTAAVANNDPVAVWVDSAAGALSNAINAAGTIRPLLQTNFLNGLSVLKFDGANDTVGGGMVAAAEQTWFVVAKKVGAISGVVEDCLLGIRQASGNRARILTVNTAQAANQYAYFPNEAVGYSPLGGDPTQWQIIALTLTAAVGKAWAGGGNGSAAFDPNVNCTTSVAYTVCSDNSQSASVGDFYVAEIRRYLSVFSNPNLDYVGKELAEKYSLPWTAVA